jgi:hypothetical protein
VLTIYPVHTLPAIIWSALLPVYLTRKFCDKFHALVFKSPCLCRPNNSLGYIISHGANLYGLSLHWNEVSSLACYKIILKISFQWCKFHFWTLFSFFLNVWNRSDHLCSRCIKNVLKVCVMRMWITFIWFWMRYSGVLLWTHQWTFWFPERAYSEKGLCFMLLVMCFLNNIHIIFYLIEFSTQFYSEYILLFCRFRNSYL